MGLDLQKFEKFLDMGRDFRPRAAQPSKNNSSTPPPSKDLLEEKILMHMNFGVHFCTASYIGYNI